MSHPPTWLFEYNHMSNPKEKCPAQSIYRMIIDANDQIHRDSLLRSHNYLEHHFHHSLPCSLHSSHEDLHSIPLTCQTHYYLQVFIPAFSWYYMIIKMMILRRNKIWHMALAVAKIITIFFLRMLYVLDIAQASREATEWSALHFYYHVNVSSLFSCP